MLQGPLLEEVIRAALQLWGGGLMRACVAVALVVPAHGHGAYHDLVAEIDRQIATHPDDAALYARRAFLHAEHGDWRASLADADRADGLKKDDLSVDLIRARALVAGGQAGEAMKVLDRFIAAHPGNPSGLVLRARLHDALGESGKAAGDYLLAMSGVPAPEPDQVFEMTELLCKAGRKEAALDVLDTALRRMSGLQSLVDRAVEIEWELGRQDAALRRMDDVIRGARVQEPLLAKRAALLARTGRTLDSIAAWKEIQTRITAMPPNERGSHAMSRLFEQARHAAESLANLAPESESAK